MYPHMSDLFTNWKVQIRKGYLELCILLLIQQHKRLYGFDLLEKLRDVELDLKEGTVYPLLNRMTNDNVLKAVWETEQVKGHPRKFYSLTPSGTKLLESMKLEFANTIKIFNQLR